MTEQIDAAQALGQIEVLDREAVRAALRTTLIKQAAHLGAFDLVFDVYFSTFRGSQGPDRSDDAAAGDGDAPGVLGQLADDDLREVLVRSLWDQDGLLVQRVVAEAVERYAGFEPGRPVAGMLYRLRTMRGIDENAVRTILVGRIADAGSADALATRLDGEHVDRVVHELELQVEAEIRRRLVRDRGALAVGRTLRNPLPEDVEFLRSSQRDAAEMRETVRPLAQRLASRLQRKRRRRAHGVLDFRRTIRSAMSTGGVAVEPNFRPRRPAKPQLVVLADISGSVAAFASFTLSLAYALRSEFAAVRSFVFIDGVDEVTDVLAGADDIAAISHDINAQGSGMWLDGRSDYGHAFEAFAERYANQLTRRSTVLILGDARTNYHDPRTDALTAVARRAGRVFWLNPEPRNAWDSGDSVMQAYGAHCERVVECRTVRQLHEFVESLE